MKLNTDDYELLIDEFGDREATETGCSVSLCRIGQTGFLEYDGTLTLNTVFQNVDVYDLDGSEFFIVKGNKALLITEPIAFDNTEEFFEYVLDLGDVEESKIDPKIKHSRTNWYVTSNEDVIE